MDGFSSVLATQGRLTTRSGRRKRRQARVRRPTPDHPDMAALNGRQVQTHICDSKLNTKLIWQSYFVAKFIKGHLEQIRFYRTSQYHARSVSFSLVWSSVFVCLTQACIPSFWSMPVRWTLSRMSTYSSVDNPGSRSWLEPIFIVVFSSESCVCVFHNISNIRIVVILIIIVSYNKVFCKTLCNP